MGEGTRMYSFILLFTKQPFIEYPTTVIFLLGNTSYTKIKDERTVFASMRLRPTESFKVI